MNKQDSLDYEDAIAWYEDQIEQDKIEQEEVDLANKGEF